MERTLYTLTQPVFLIGFMGAGKTTMARRLARECGLICADTDRCMERKYGMSAKELYEQAGEEGFRQMEAETLEEFVQGEPRIIACGGGIVMGERSREIIRTCGFAVYVHVTADESAERISNHDSRPFFHSMESVRLVNQVRVPLYEELADVTVDSSSRTSGRMAYEVKDILVKEGILCPVRK